MKITASKLNIKPNAINERKLTTAIQSSLIEQIDIINKSLDKGKGRLGRLRNYSKKYRDWRKEEGLTTTPNLAIKGELRQSMKVEKIARQTGAEIGFFGSHYSGKQNVVIASEVYKKGFVGWFALNEEDEKRIYKRIKQQLDKANFIT